MASNAEEQSKFKDLTVKCLIKVTKSLDDDIKTDRVTRALVTVSFHPAALLLCSRHPLPCTAKETLLHGQQISALLSGRPL